MPHPENMESFVKRTREELCDEKKRRAICRDQEESFMKRARNEL